MEHNTRHATKDDFGNRLSYRLYDTGPNPESTPELWDLHAIEHSVETLRQTFERLERAGVCIPTVHGVGYGEEEPNRWRDLPGKIRQNRWYLDGIVIKLLSEERRRTVDLVCCG